MSRYIAGTAGFVKQTEVDTEAAAPYSAANFEEEPASKDRMCRSRQSMHAGETEVALSELVNQMIDDQTMLQAYQVLCKAKAMKKL